MHSVITKNSMNLSAFRNQPNENNDLRLKVIIWLNNEGYDVVNVDGVFDLLVVNRTDNGMKIIELKVRLKSQNWAILISKKQWLFLANTKVSDRLSNKLRYLIYCSQTKKYSLCKSSDLRGGIQSNTKPNSTSYIRSKYLNELNWQSTTCVSNSIRKWLK